MVTSILINGRGRYIDSRDGTKGLSTTPFEYLKIVSVQNNLYLPPSFNQWWQCFLTKIFHRQTSVESNRF